MPHAAPDVGSGKSPPRNLPTVLTSFVGRAREFEELSRLVMSARLVTLTGSAGSGKTRLALRLAGAASDRYADGVHWIELAPLDDPSLVAPAVAKAVKAVEHRGRPLLASLSAALRDKQLLLVLDNCEHLVGACAALAQAVLAAPGVSILATSREPLGVAGELLYPLSSMALPPPDHPARHLEQFDAIRLFVERARAAVPPFDLTPANAPAVVAICRRLDGIPLAIELASARLSVLSLEQIAARLDDRFALLSDATRMTYSPHRSLRAALDWSYDLLTPPEQALLRRLSVFAGGCSLASVEAVCAGGLVERARVLDLLASLVGKSLVVARTLAQTEARYALLETIRQYAQERLGASLAEASAVRDRHLEYFLWFAEDARAKLEGKDQQQWLNRLEIELANVRAALARALESDRIEIGLRICNALYQFWTIRDYAEEGLAWVQRFETGMDERVPLLIRASALAFASMLAGFRGNAAAQLNYGREAAVLAESAGDEGKVALQFALQGMVWAAHAAGDHQSAFDLLQRETQLYRELGNTVYLGIALYGSGFAAMSLGNYDVARAMLAESLLVLRPTGNTYRIAMALNYTGDLARCEQDFAGARAAYEESVSLLREIGAARDIASALQNLGHACLRLGDADRARRLFSESMAIQQAQRNTPGIAEGLLGFGALALARGMPAACARLLAAAVEIGGERLVTAWAATRMEYQHCLGLVRSRLSEQDLQVEQAAGRRLSLEQAVAYAQSLMPASAVPAEIETGADTLTAREREIAALIAHGKSNGEIARQLVVSKRTVEKHIANILAKLGFTSRAQIVRWAIESGLAKLSP